jgi:hypothetical protein
MADHAHMTEGGLHYIADDLKDSWVQDWAVVGITQIEALLSKHAAFLSYLDAQEQ